MKVTDRIEILYPQSEDAKYIAKALREKLLSYRPPRTVAKRAGERSVRDIEDDWLIVICTEDTPRDASITEAVASQIDAGKRNRILTVLASDSPAESFPEALCFEVLEDGTRVEREPLACNIAAGSPAASVRKLNVERLRLLAPMFGVSFDDLMNRRRRSRRAVILAVLFAALTGSFIFFFYALSKVRIMNAQNVRVKEELAKAEASEKEATDEKNAARQALAKSVAIRAKTALEDEDTELSLLLSLEFLQEEAEVPELIEIFDEALKVRCRKGYYPVTTARAYSRTGRKLRGLSELTSTTTCGNAECIRVDDDTEALFAEDPEDITYIYKTYGFDDLIIGLARHGFSVYSAETHELLYHVHDKNTDLANVTPAGTYWNGFIAAALPDGTRRIVVDLMHVYDAETGEYLYEIEDYGQGIVVNKGVAELTKEGYFPLLIGGRLVFLDLRDGSFEDSIYSVGRTVFYLSGEVEEETGRPTGTVVYMSHFYSSIPSIVWEYNREEIPIPEDLDGKIELAVKLLAGRTLTYTERRNNYLEEGE
ncbi:MAG: hypothetical protein K5796_03775 [Lachnospiraceae bacterium]|nr:hypothetical protein [Lachnospiraceae bacterium]